METPLGVWLSYKIAEQQISQREFSQKVGLAQSVVSNIISKGHIPTHEVLVKLADYLGVSWFFIYRLAGLLPQDIDLEHADPAVVAALEDTARMLSEFPLPLRERVLGGIRTIIAAYAESESVSAE